MSNSERIARYVYIGPAKALFEGEERYGDARRWMSELREREAQAYIFIYKDNHGYEDAYGSGEGGSPSSSRRRIGNQNGVSQTHLPSQSGVTISCGV
jgi:hypothetical protein